MSGSATPNLDLHFLDASQAQPEVKINDAWEKIDAFAAEATGVNVIGVDVSPDVTVSGARTLKFTGATVTEESDNTVLVDVSGSGLALTVNDIDESPTALISNVAKITFRGATVSSESGSGALVHVDYQGVTVGGTWVSALGAITVPINDILRFLAAKARIIRCTVLTQGGPGSCTIKIAKANLSAHFPPVVTTDDITGGTNVVIGSGVSYDNSTLTGWSTLVAPGDVLLLSLTANATFTGVSIFLSLGHDT